MYVCVNYLPMLFVFDIFNESSKERFLLLLFGINTWSLVVFLFKLSTT